jgi:hypothetical protein
MKKFVKFLDEKLLVDNEFTKNFVFTLFLAIAFAAIDIVITIKKYNYNNVCKSAITYIIPSLNTLYLSCNIVQKKKSYVDAMIWLSLVPYLFYLRASSHFIANIVFSLFFVGYIYFVNTYVTDVNEIDYSEVNVISKISA